MFLAAQLDPVQWILAGAAVISGVAAVAAVVTQRRRDNSDIDTRAGSVAANVTNAALNVQNAALDRAEKDIERLTAEVAECRTEIRGMRLDVEQCHAEKDVLARRVAELERAGA